MLRRKYELLEKHVHKLCDKQLKNCGKKLKKHNYGIYHHEWYFNRRH